MSGDKKNPSKIASRIVSIKAAHISMDNGERFPWLGIKYQRKDKRTRITQNRRGFFFLNRVTKMSVLSINTHCLH